MQLKGNTKFFGPVARTETATSDSVATGSCGRGHFIIVVSSVTSTPSVVPTIQGYDVVSNSWYDLLVGAAITATGTTVLKIGPGYTPSANAVASDSLPDRVRLVMTHADTDSITYTASVNLMP